MGQLFAVQSSDAIVTEALFSRGLAAFASLVGVSAIDKRQGKGFAVAKFPKTRALSPGITTDGRRSLWICGAGTWLYGNLAGEKAQTKLLAGMIDRCELSDTVLEDLDGPFVFVSGRTNTNEISIVTDRVGTLHVYRAQTPNAVLISTSSLVLAALLTPSWDLVSCREFLGTGTVFEQRTLFQGIEKLPPASVLLFKSGKLHSARKYWDLSSRMYDRAVVTNSIEAMAEALEDSVARIQQGYPKAVFDLTGGLDSRAVVGAALRSGVPIHSVVNGDPTHADVEIANRVARQFQLHHRHQHPDTADEDPWVLAQRALPFCDGEYDLIEYATTLGHQSRLATEFDVSVNGSGGEMAKGYWWELLYPVITRRDNFDDRRLSAVRFAVNVSGADLVQGPPIDMVDHFAQVIRRTSLGFEALPNTAKMDNIYITMRMQRWQGRIASATARLWNCVSPFLFRRPMQIALATAPRHRVRNRMSRRLITHFDRRLAAIPIADGGPALPLTPATAHLFWPLAWHMGQKLYRRLPLSGTTSTSASYSPVTGGYPALAPFLEPKLIAARDIFDQERVKEFFKQSAWFSVLVRRVLSLEMLARSVRVAGFDSAVSNP